MPLVVRASILWQAGVPEAVPVVMMWWMLFDVVGYGSVGRLKARPNSGR